MLFIIDDILEKMALENKNYFSPHYICQLANVSDLKGVTEYLLRQVNSKLKVYYEVECPEGDSDFAVQSLEDFPSEPRECHICGIEYLPNLDRVWVTFEFIPEYVEYLKKKKQQNKHLALI